MKLSINMTPKNWGPTNKNLLKVWNPKTIFIKEPKKEVIQDCLMICPESLLVLDLPRNQVNRKIFAGQAGDYHAKFWGDRIEDWNLEQDLSKIVFCGMTWTDEGEVVAANQVIKYSRNLLSTAMLANPQMRIGIRNMNPSGRESWDEFFNFFQTTITKVSRHFLILEDYWDSRKPKVFGKHLFKLGEEIPIIIGETGIRIEGKNWIESKINPSDYLKSLREYEISLDSDNRIHSACLSTLDGPIPGEFVGDLLPSLGRNTSFSLFSDMRHRMDLDESWNSLENLARENVVLHPDISSPLVIAMWDNGISPIGYPAFTYRGGVMVVTQLGMDLRSGQTYTFTQNEGGDDTVRYKRN